MGTNEYDLSAQQLSFFEVFGYLAFPGLLADRIGDVSEEFEHIWDTQGGGHHGQPHDFEQRSCIAQFIDRSASLSSLLDDPRILGIATTLLGDDFNYMGSDGNLYAGETDWHSDGRHGQILHVKLAFYLDPVDSGTGCIRVIPGSHRLGESFERMVHHQLRDDSLNLGINGCDVPAVALETQPGDVVCFNHNTKHAAFGGSGRRRMFTMNLCQRFPEEYFQELRDYMAGGSRFWVERAYGDAMIDTAGPDRMVHLEQCLENDEHLAALSKCVREKMDEPARG